ncbi:MAG: DUF4405 domain-containing protein [Lachnospiraceae bacterium]|nr:DUF4405 domain-containing protein [Lachnospiraceae bacterium]
MDMKPIKVIRIIIDIIMYLLFILLMGQHLLAGAVHEYLGTGLFVCFFIHCVFNYRWYKGLFKGKYTLRRSIWTVVNLLLLISFVVCILSSFMISGVVFRNIRLAGMMMVGRKLHLVSTAWSFVLMSIHLGFHIRPPKQKMQKSCFYIITSAASVIGIYIFSVRKFYEELFLLTEFKWFDYDKSWIRYTLETICISLCFVMLAHAVMQAGNHWKEKRKDGKRV